MEAQYFGVPDSKLFYGPDVFILKASSHGMLLCSGFYDPTVFYLTNPVRSTYTEIPSNHHKSQSKFVLDYDPNGRNYSIVSGTYDWDEDKTEFQIYDSVVGEWRVVPNKAESCRLDDGKGVIIGGAAYWCSLYMRSRGKWETGIVSLDLTTGKIDHIYVSYHSGCVFGAISSMLTIVSPIKDYGFLIYGYNATPRKPVWERRDFEIELFDRRGINTKDCYFSRTSSFCRT